MSRPYTYLYNPRKASTEELKRTLVGRQAVLEQLLDHLRIHAHSRSLQHLLLVAPRGWGKTHLLTLLGREVREGPLAASWRPLQLAEEEWGVGSLRELVIAVFEALEHAPRGELEALPPAVQPAEALPNLRGCADDEGGELGLALLRELARSSGRRTLLLVENLDMLLEEQFHDPLGLRRLRSELMTGDSTLVVATSPGDVKALRDHDNPMFELFRPLRLAPLGLDELERLLLERARFDCEQDTDSPAGECVKRLQSHPATLRALLYLTGGNPRTALMLYRVAQQQDLSRIGPALEGLLDELTSTYRDRLRDLPPQERKAVLAIARSGRAMRPSEIAAEIQVSAAQGSTIVGRLVGRGLLRLAPQREGRGRYYILNEVLLRYWHEWRARQQEFTLLLEFLAAWFEREELEDWLAREADPQRASLLQRAISEQPLIRERLEMHLAVQPLVSSSGSGSGASDLTDPLLSRIIEDHQVESDSSAARLVDAHQYGDWDAWEACVEELSLTLVDGAVPAAQEVGALARLVAEATGERPLRAAQAVKDRRPHDPLVLFLLVRTLRYANKRLQAVQLARGLEDAFVVDDDPLALGSVLLMLANLELFLGKQQTAYTRIARARQAFESAGSRLGIASSLEALGELHFSNDRLSDAGAAYDEALVLCESIEAPAVAANVLLGLGDVHAWSQRLEEAEAAYDDALSYHRKAGNRLGTANVLLAKGRLRFRAGQFAEAEAGYREALALYRSLEDRRGETNCLLVLGQLSSMRGEPIVAFRDLLRLHDAYRRLQDWTGEQAALASLAVEAASAGATDQALLLAEVSLEAAREAGVRGTQKLALEVQLELCLAGHEVVGRLGSALVLRTLLLADGQEASLAALDGQVTRLGEQLPSEVLAAVEAEPEQARRGAIERARKRFSATGRDLFEPPPSSPLEDLQRLRKAHPDLFNVLFELRELVTSREPDPKAPPAAFALLPVAMADEAQARVIAGGIFGGVIELLARRESSQALSWLDAIEAASPAGRAGLLEPLRLAARVVQDAPEDRRLLDQLAPDVRGAVEMVLEKAGCPLPEK